MILIMGGAYQGKKDFARERFNAATFYDCAAAAKQSSSEEAGEPAEDPASTSKPGKTAAKTASDNHTHVDVKAVSGRPVEETGRPGLCLPDFSADAICGLEDLVWTCCAEDPADRVEAADLFRRHQPTWQDKILIINDVSQGIVPMDPRTRAFREMNGRLMLYLASQADQVWRVFCGIGKRIK